MAQLIFVYLGEEYPIREVADAEAAEDAAGLNSECRESGGIVIVRSTDYSEDLEPEYSQALSG